MEIRCRPVPAAADRLRAAGVHPVLARIYAARGIASPAELERNLGALPSYRALRGVAATAERLALAIERAERIVVVADYDADGATACAVAVRGLAALGAEVGFVVPNRFEHGYGLTPEIVHEAARLRPRVVLTVDNGIASHDGVAAAAALGIDVVVTDHHLPGASLPPTPWIVNPNQPDCAFACKHLAGVGVVFYVLTALRALLRETGRLPASGPNLARLLDLVALGTVADVVRLDGVNRILVAQGLARIRSGRAHPGVVALLRAAGRDPARATTDDLAFGAAPRLNAAGRLADMSLGIRCLLAEDETTAAQFAGELDRLNRERRDIEADMHESALLELADRATDPADSAYTVCLFHPEWHPGVVGIVASRLKERLHRPAVVFARGAAGELRGSGRSIAGFHLRDAFDLVAKRAPGSITRFGGHAFAAGLTIPEDALAAFGSSLEAIAREQLSPAHLRQALDTDGSLAPEELDFELVRTLGDEVWGQGFPAPLFGDEFAVTGQRIVGEKHSRLQLARPGQRVEAILFNCADPLPARILAVYRPELSAAFGSFALQLVIEHWHAMC